MCAKAAGPRLGRGLAALLGDVQFQPNAGPVGTQQVPIDLLDSSPYQPRSEIDEAALEELAGSIKTHGLLQPLLVREHPVVAQRYQIIAGERRWRAAAKAGLHDVPVLVRSMTDTEAAAAALVENLQRQNLNPMDEADGYQRLVQDFGLTHEAMGTAIGKSRAHIGNMLRLLRLPERTKQAVRDGTVSFGHARALLGHSEPDSVVDRVIAHGLSVRQTEALVARRESDKSPPAPPTPESTDARDLEARLAATLGQRVQIKTTERGGGTLTIHFSDLYQLEELTDRLYTK